MGLFECMTRYRFMFGTSRYGLSGSLSYLYYLLYELYSPLIELAGVAVTVLAAFLGLLNLRFMVFFFLLYAVYGAGPHPDRLFAAHLHAEAQDQPPRHRPRPACCAPSSSRSSASALTTCAPPRSSAIARTGASGAPSHAHGTQRAPVPAGNGRHGKADRRPRLPYCHFLRSLGELTV